MAVGDACELLCLDLEKAEALRTTRLEPGPAGAATSAARSLADETRLTLVSALRAGGELCGCDLAWVCERSQALVSHHLKTLREAGVVASRREGKMVMYSLTARGQGLLDAVLQAAGAKVA